MEKKFIVEQKQLLAVLTAMQPICTRRTTLDATSCIMFHVSARELILKSTDLEISLQVSCQVSDCSLRESEQFLVPGKRIFDIVKELNGAIELELQDNQLHIVCEGVQVSLHIKDSQEFPPLPERIENLDAYRKRCIQRNARRRELFSSTEQLKPRIKWPSYRGWLARF